VIHRGFVALTRSVETHVRHGDWLAGEVSAYTSARGAGIARGHCGCARYGHSLGRFGR
jgi:hypothetical protein